jgi:hypothetical protein
MSKEAEEVFKHRDDPGEWEEDAEVIEVRPSGSEVVSFRIPADQLTDLEGAASVAGETLSEYIRYAIAIRMHGRPVGPVVAVTHQGGSVMFVQSHFVTAGRFEGDEPRSNTIPKWAPRTASL